MNTNVQSWKDYVPQSVSLYYVDYRENLDEHEELQEKCIRQNDLMPLTKEVLEWYMEPITGTNFLMKSERKWKGTESSMNTKNTWMKWGIYFTKETIPIPQTP